MRSCMPVFSAPMRTIKLWGSHPCTSWVVAQQRRRSLVTLAGKWGSRTNAMSSNGPLPATDVMRSPSSLPPFRYSLVTSQYKTRASSRRSPASHPSYTPLQPLQPVSSDSMVHPKTYKAFAFFEKGGDLKPITFDWREPGPGEVVVKVLACSVCAG